jgi:uncharacterized coiled-coil protein SlyX
MTQEKSGIKIGNKTTVIALSAICIILAAGLVGVIAIYNPIVTDLQSKVDNNENTIASLNSQIASLNSTVSSLNTQVASLTTSLNQSNTNAATLQELISDYYQKLTLSQHGYLVNNVQLTQDAGNITSLWTNYVDYAGYIVFQVESTSSTTYAKVTYSMSSPAASFNYTATVGVDGTSVFPVLPGLLNVGIGNFETTNPVNATVSIVYYY